jgi:uncharacterized SAM-binding protein YcdF (DUF218 family)
VGPGPVRESAAVGTPASPSSRSRTSGHRWRRFVLFLAVLLALYLFRAPLLTALARFLDVSEAPEKVDYVMVLGGDANVRPFVAAALYRRGLASKVLVPVMKPSPENRAEGSPAGQSVIRDVLQARGVADADILLLDGEVTSTRDEGAALARFLEDHPGSSVAVVTTNYHTRRARGIFRKVASNRASRVIFVAAPTEDFDAHNWWQSKAGSQAYLTEYAKLLYYTLRY